MPNRLAQETSPYLLQHKDNPVDWYPWGDDAFQRARTEDKPVFLSVGYSSCHWCHVMEHESFENTDIARLMNERFINVKVDREERPDVDSIYMSAVQAMTGHGGWPMSVFLTPEGRPFYAGTYFPPSDRGGLPAFPSVLEAVADAYASRREEVLSSTERVVQYLTQQAQSRASAEPLTRDLLGEAYRALVPGLDHEQGGTRGAPKFPQAMTYEFLLRQWHSTHDPQPLRLAELTLQRMARGGIYDQLGGGFHRYSTDTFWLVPHFEKMLYDNAQLASVYVQAHQATGNPLYRRVAEETLSYVEREMLDAQGGFFSAQDADSEGEEGKFFVWTKLEVDLALGPELAPIARAYYGVTEAGNFEGRNILWAHRPDDEVAAELGLGVDELHDALTEARARLLDARARRIAPGRDDKVLTSWNALMLRAFAEAGAVFENAHYLQIARRNADFLLDALFDQGRLLRTWKDGRARLHGYLEDYAYVIEALLALYEATFEERWLQEADRLARGMIDLFWDEEQGIFFDTGHDHERLIVRPRDIFDNATPSGNSSASFGLFRLAAFTGNTELQRYAVTNLRSVRDFLARAPSGFAHWLAALDFYLSSPKEIAIIGRLDDPATAELVRVVHSLYLPNRILAGAESEQPGSLTPLVENRSLVNGRPAAYVCERYVCQTPVTDAASLRKQLDAAS
jgi:uncharacterized protein YyaL (SSP411 family)